MTNNVRAAILIPGATPLLYPTLAHKSPSGPLSPSSATPESPSDPLSLRERVRVRALDEPNPPEHNRTKPNRSSLHRLRLDLPGPSKTNHPQPLCPRKTLDFRLIRPSEKNFFNHRPPTALRAAPADVRTTRSQPNPVEQSRTRPNSFTCQNVRSDPQNWSKIVQN